MSTKKRTETSSNYTISHNIPPLPTLGPSKKNNTIITKYSLSGKYLIRPGLHSVIASVWPASPFLHIFVVKSVGWKKAGSQWIHERVAPCFLTVQLSPPFPPGIENMIQKFLQILHLLLSLLIEKYTVISYVKISMDEIPVTSLFLLPTGLLCRVQFILGKSEFEPWKYAFLLPSKLGCSKCKILRFDDGDAHTNNLSYKCGEN